MSDNPKAVEGRKKSRTSAIPQWFVQKLGQVMQHGREKYGRFNWRIKSIKATDYWDAIDRHMDAWKAGEDIDPDSGIHHLIHVAANCAVVTDAQRMGSLIDDRNKAEVIEEGKAVIIAHTGEATDV